MRLLNRLLISILLFSTVKCNEVQNFNENLREYSDVKDLNASSNGNIRTLQSARYAHFVPSIGPVAVKDVSDNALASSSNVKGFTSHSKIGYVTHDEHGPEYGYYGHDYYLPSPHEFDHHHDHDHDHGHGHHPGYHHYKHYDHGLATKAILWPIAGIALLGAAAALVSNPILLQLGVVSGKRRRRDTEEITGPDFETDFLKTLKKNKYEHKTVTENTNDVGDKNKEKKKKPMKNKIQRQDTFLKREHRFKPSKILDSYLFPSTRFEDDGLVPIPLQVRRQINN